MASRVLLGLLAVLFCIVRFSNAYAISDSPTKPIRKSLSHDSYSLDVLQDKILAREKKALAVWEEATKQFIARLKKLYHKIGLDMNYKTITFEEFATIDSTLRAKGMSQKWDELLEWYSKQFENIFSLPWYNIWNETAEDQLTTRHLPEDRSISTLGKQDWGSLTEEEVQRLRNFHAKINQISNEIIELFEQNYGKVDYNNWKPPSELLKRLEKELGRLRVF